MDVFWVNVCTSWKHCLEYVLSTSPQGVQFWVLWTSSELTFWTSWKRLEDILGTRCVPAGFTLECTNMRLNANLTSGCTHTDWMSISFYFRTHTQRLNTIDNKDGDPWFSVDDTYNTVTHTQDTGQAVIDSLIDIHLEKHQSHLGHQSHIVQCAPDISQLPIGRAMDVFHELNVWPKFHLHSCCAWCNIVLHCTSIYWVYSTMVYKTYRNTHAKVIHPSLYFTEWQNNKLLAYFMRYTVCRAEGPIII